MDGHVRELKLVSGPPRPLRRHFHEEYSLAFVHEGRSRSWAPGREAPVEGGQLVLIPPRVPHACNAEGGAAWSYSLLLLDPAWVDLEARWVTPPSGLVAIRVPGPGFPAQDAIRAAAGGGGALEEVARRAIGLVARALRADGLAGAGGSSGAAARLPPAGIRRARERLDSGCPEGVSLDELAAASGLSKYRLIRAFKESYGLTPRAYLICARVNRAKRLLAAGRRIADVALECGFCDQSHLHRAFESRAGRAPGRYPAS